MPDVPSNLPLIQREFWEILRTGTYQLAPQTITRYGLSGQLAAIAFLEAGKEVVDTTEVINSFRKVIQEALLAAVKDIIGNSKAVSNMMPDTEVVLKSRAVADLAGLTNDLFFIERTVNNIPFLVKYIKSDESGLSGIVKPVCEQLVEAFVKNHRKAYIPNYLYHNIATFEELMI